MTLNDELIIIDETIAELEVRRTEIIGRMEASGRPSATARGESAAPANIIVFPTRPSVIESRYNNQRHVW